MAQTGLLTLDELRAEVEAGRVDTVLLAMADMQGRLQGKRLAATHFLDDVLHHNAEGCNYLLAVDVDMNTVSGYAMSSWDRGYGDFVFKPDLSTLRMVPWQEHGPGHVRPHLGGRQPGAGLARGVLRRQLERLAERGWVAYAGTELEFIVFRDSYEEAWAKAYRDLRPANDYNVDYSLLGTARIEPLLRHPQLHGRGRPAGRVGQGRVQLRPARDRLPLHRRPGHRRRASSTRTGPRRSPPRTAAA